MNVGGHKLRLIHLLIYFGGVADKFISDRFTLIDIFEGDQNIF